MSHPRVKLQQSHDFSLSHFHNPSSFPHYEQNSSYHQKRPKLLAQMMSINHGHHGGKWSYTGTTSNQAVHICLVWYRLFTFEHTLQISLPHFLRSLLQAWRWLAYQLAVFSSCWHYVSKSRLVMEWKAYLPTVHINECHSFGTIWWHYKHEHNSLHTSSKLQLLGEPKVLISLTTEAHSLLFAHLSKALVLNLVKFLLESFGFFWFLQTGVTQIQQTVGVMQG